MTRRGLPLALLTITACASSRPPRAEPTVAPAALPAMTNSADASVAPPPRAHAVAVERRTMRLDLRSSVTITPAVTASAVSHMSGVARTLTADTNDRVRAGQVLAVVGPANGAPGRTEQVRAPVDGTVLTRHVELAAPVQGDRTVLYTLADLTRLTARALAPEARARFLRVGLPVELRVDAMPERTFQSTVSMVGQVLTAAHEQPFEFPLSNADMTLRPGMGGEARVELDHHDDALVVPDEALSSLDSPTVFVVTEGRARAVHVRFGFRSGGVTEITEGLTPEDRVLVPAALVREGDRVEE